VKKISPYCHNPMIHRHNVWGDAWTKNAGRTDWNLGASCGAFGWLDGVWVVAASQSPLRAFVAKQKPHQGNHRDHALRSIGYWREALFTASTIHGEGPYGAKGW
jgi:hypothetical protein